MRCEPASTPISSKLLPRTSLWLNRLKVRSGNSGSLVWTTSTATSLCNNHRIWCALSTLCSNSLKMKIPCGPLRVLLGLAFWGRAVWMLLYWPIQGDLEAITATKCSRDRAPLRNSRSSNKTHSITRVASKRCRARDRCRRKLQIISSSKSIKYAIKTATCLVRVSKCLIHSRIQDTTLRSQRLFGIQCRRWTELEMDLKHRIKGVSCKNNLL